MSNKKKTNENNYYVATINEILKQKKIHVPLYQRPYEWTRKNVLSLLLDIEYGIKRYKKNNLKYKIGTIILHNNKEEKKLEIVDGQQRLITLCLILKKLNMDNGIKLLSDKIQYSEITYNNIKDNYEFINIWFDRKEDKIYELYKKYILKSIDFFVIETKNQNLAFQLFDSNNSKGKLPTPTDLLKAYHLQNMNNLNKKEKRDIIVKWENREQEYFSDVENKNYDNKIDIIHYNEDNKIVSLFKNYLFPIYNWSINQKNSNYFSKDDIYLYKGIENKIYNYGKVYDLYYHDNNNYIFTINKPFPKGKYFFEMVEYYINKLEKIMKENNLYLQLKYSKDNSKDINYIEKWKRNDGSIFVKNIYYAAILFFHDKFGFSISNMEYVDYLIFKWAMNLRISSKSINYRNINSYIVDGINIFYKIENARTIEELENIEIPKTNSDSIEKYLVDFRKDILERINKNER